jgi:hypothetical protein
MRDRGTTATRGKRQQRTGLREIRVSCRVSLEEWRLLSKIAERGGFKTVSGLIRDVLGRYSTYVIRRASEVQQRSIGAEIAAMFRNYEDTGMDWCDDVNKRL